MYEELIQALQLHCEAGKRIGLSGAIWTLLGDASTALDALTAQLAALQAENAELRTQHRTEHCEASGYDCAELGRLRAAIFRVEAERDAAIKDLSGLCWCCKHGKKWDKAPVWSKMTTCERMKERGVVAVGGGKSGCDHWEWHGAQGEG